MKELPPPAVAATHVLEVPSVHAGSSGLDRQVEITSGYASSHPDDVVANEGAAAACQNREIFSPPTTVTSTKGQRSTSAAAAPAARRELDEVFPSLARAATTRPTAASRAAARPLANGHAASGGWMPEGRSRPAAGTIIDGSDLDEDELDAMYDLGTDASSEDERLSSSTVRSDYGVLSSEDDTVIDVIPTTATASRVPPLGNDPLEMAAKGTLPQRRFKIPDRVVDNVEEYVSRVDTTLFVMGFTPLPLTPLQRREC
jgi:hypothetical protein